MILWQANLGRGVTTEEFTHNLCRVLAAAGPRAAICFQEIDEADAPEEMDILRELVADTHTIVGGNTAVPILVPKHLPLERVMLTTGCRGLAKFTPHRVINEAVVRLPNGLEVAILNTHLPINRPQTLTRRREVRKALRRRARARAAGAWTADTNTHVGWPRIARRERTVINGGIDKAKAWAPKGWRVVVSDRHTVDLTIDGHSAHGARIRWEKR